MYPIKNLIFALETNHKLNSLLLEMKECVIKRFLSQEIHKSITKRIDFYYVKQQKGDKFPSENCASKIIRFIERKPEPYYYDYGVSKPDIKLLENSLYMVKQRYGYGNRNSSVCASGRPRLCSSRNNMSDKKNCGSITIKYAPSRRGSKRQEDIRMSNRAESLEMRCSPTRNGSKRQEDIRTSNRAELLFFPNKIFPEKSLSLI